MSCKKDIRQGILDKAMSELVEGRYTFTRLNVDTIRINSKLDNSKSKAAHVVQAKSIAKEVIERTDKSFNNQVRGSMSQHSIYDPVTVTFDVNPAYIDYEYNKLPKYQRTDPSEDNSLSPTIDNSNNEVDYKLKILTSLEQPKAEELFNRWYNKDREKFWREMNNQVPRDQIEFLQTITQGQDIKSADDLKLAVLTNMSYTVEINTTLSKKQDISDQYDTFNLNNIEYGVDAQAGYYKGDTPITEEEFRKAAKEYYGFGLNTQYYSNLTVPGGTNYTENEIATPAITPSIQSHAAFKTEHGIGWFRSDDKQNYNEQDIDTLINNMKNSGVLEINCS